MSERLFGRRLSSGEVSKANQKPLETVEQCRNRSLAGQKFLYLFLDGTNFTMRRGDEIEKQCVLVVVGVDESRQRLPPGNSSLGPCCRIGMEVRSGRWQCAFRRQRIQGDGSEELALVRGGCTLPTAWAQGPVLVLDRDVWG
jgi:hypothetical protein